jgi:SNF2 family DNA or RNA helicase
MTDYWIKITSPFTLEICFGTSPARHQKKCITSLSEQFEWDLSEQKLRALLKMIQSSDGTASMKLNRDGFFIWKIDLTNFPNISNRFRPLLPFLCKSVSLSKALYQFQIRGRDWLLAENSRILADDMGLGKIIQAISAMESLFFTNKVETVLVICPVTLISNWENEIRRWCPLLSVARVTNDQIDKNFSVRNYVKNNNIIITTYSTLSNLTGIIEKNFFFDLIVADEAHKLRNATSKTNRSFRSIKRHRTWLLTGTPLERDVDDIKNMLVCLEPDSARALDMRGDNVLYKSKLTNLALRRLKRDVLKDLPNVQRIVEVLDMPLKQKHHYQKILKEMRAARSDERIGFLTKLSFSAIAGGGVESCKIIRATEICESAEISNKKVIVFSNYNEALKLLKSELIKNNISALLITGESDRLERDRTISKFKKSDSFTTLLCNSKIASEGLTLTEASIVVFLNEWWNPSSNRQAEDRVNRIGQENKVTIYVLRSNNTIDENVGNIITDKTDLEDEFVGKLIELVV